MSDAGLAPDEARAVAWCAAADVAAGVTTDDAGAAMRGWLSAAYRAAADAGVEVSSVDWFIPHQANQRILEGVAKRLGIDIDEVGETEAIRRIMAIQMDQGKA